MSTIRDMLVISLLTALAVVVQSCAGGSQKMATRPAVKPEVGEPPSTAPSAESVRLAEQIQRDADWLLGARSKETEEEAVGAGDPLTRPERVAAEAVDSRPPSIEWTSGTAEVRAPEVNVPVAGDDEAPVMQSPLFRDEPSLPPAEVGAGVAAKPVQVDLQTPDRLHQLMVELKAELDRRAASSDTPLSYLIPIAAMSIADPDRAVDPERYYDLDDEDRALLGALQRFFSAVGEHLPSAEAADEVIAEAVQKLEEDLAGSLALPTATLCIRVDGFGSYEPFEKNVFLAHAEQQVIVYLEIDEFASELNDRGQWATQVSQLLTIYGDDGLAVWGGRDWETATDMSTQRRRDFFTVQLITLPDALGVGKYTLKIRARDEQTGAEAERTIPFEMVADPQIAARVH